MKSAFIFGAGASAAEGASTLTALLKNSLNRFPKDGRVKEVKEFIHDFFSARYMPSFEEILTPIDVALLKQEGFSDKWNYSELSNIRNDLVYCICRTLSEELQHPKGLHKEFVQKLFREHRDLGNRYVFISLNYDILLDNALSDLYRHRIDLDYGIDFRNFGPEWKRPAFEKAVSLFKLHGSLNWLYCPVCNSVRITPQEKGVMRIFTEFEVCENEGSQQRPLIVPPTWQKAYDNPYLATIWLKTERALRESDKVFFIGCSLRESEVHLRYLLKKSLYRKNGKVIISVIDDKNGDDECESRYRRLFGRVTYLPIGFEKFIKEKSFVSEH